ALDHVLRIRTRPTPLVGPTPGPATGEQNRPKRCRVGGQSEGVARLVSRTGRNDVAWAASGRNDEWGGSGSVCLSGGSGGPDGRDRQAVHGDAAEKPRPGEVDLRQDGGLGGLLRDEGPGEGQRHR